MGNYIEDNISVIYLDLPIGYKAMTLPDGCGFYTIYLNTRYNSEQNELSYQHEIYHIENGDYEKKCNANLLELIAHLAV